MIRLTSLKGGKWVAKIKLSTSQQMIILDAINTAIGNMDSFVDSKRIIEFQEVYNIIENLELIE